MRFLCLHHSDIYSEKMWSGIPLSIMTSLKAHGHDVVVVSQLRPSTTLIGRLKGIFYKKLFHKLYLVNRDLHTFSRRAADANARIRAADKVDAVIVTQIGDAAFIKPDAPVIVIHDSTWFQLLDYYPGYERASYARETIEGGIALDKRGLQQAAHAIFASNWAAESAHKDYGIDRSKISVAPLGAILPSVPSLQECETFLRARGNGPCRFLFLGKEWHRKGGDIAVAILQEIEKQGVSVELHVVGCTPETEVPSFVQNHGTLWKKDPEQAKRLTKLFEECDFFILPTRAECFGMVFCEAAAYGLPVIASDTGGVKEVVSEDWGLALPLSSPPQVHAEWILEHYRDREKYQCISRSARSAYEARLHWGVMCEHIAETARSLQKAEAVRS
jgi:glycosyltransferase involved in cell wall biosynthesis